MSVIEFCITEGLTEQVAQRFCKDITIKAEMRGTQVYIISSNVEQIALDLIEQNQKDMEDLDLEIKKLPEGADSGILRLKHAHKDADNQLMNHISGKLQEGLELETICNTQEFLAVVDMVKEEKHLSEEEYKILKQFTELEDGRDIPDIQFLSNITKSLLMTFNPVAVAVYMLIEYIVTQTDKAEQNFQTYTQDEDLEKINKIVQKYIGVIPEIKETIEVIPDLAFIQPIIDKYAGNTDYFKDLSDIKDVILKYHNPNVPKDTPLSDLGSIKDIIDKYSKASDDIKDA